MTGKEPKLRCVLCDAVIWPDHKAHRYAEGPFCPDGASCRRRALRYIKALQAALEILSRWAEGDPDVTWQNALETMKSLGVDWKPE